MLLGAAAYLYLHKRAHRSAGVGPGWRPRYNLWQTKESATLDLADSALAFGVKELDSKKLMITFYNEVGRGGYKVMDTAELKKWVDEKKPCSSSTPCPSRTATKSSTFPARCRWSSPSPS